MVKEERAQKILKNYLLFHVCIDKAPITKPDTDFRLNNFYHTQTQGIAEEEKLHPQHNWVNRCIHAVIPNKMIETNTITTGPTLLCRTVLSKTIRKGNIYLRRHRGRAFHILKSQGAWSKLGVSYSKAMFWSNLRNHGDFLIKIGVEPGLDQNCKHHGVNQEYHVVELLFNKKWGNTEDITLQ